MISFSYFPFDGIIHPWQVTSGRNGNFGDTVFRNELISFFKIGMGVSPNGS